MTTTPGRTPVHVSYSELGSLDCWLKHDLAYKQGLKPVTPHAALRFGNVWDAFQDKWWEPLPAFAPGERVAVPASTTDERLEQALAAGQKRIHEEAARVDGLLVDRGLPRPADWSDELDRMHLLLHGMGRHYAATWGDEAGQFEVVAQQLEIDVALPSHGGRGVNASSRFRLRGKLDRLVIDRATGLTYIVDAKSTKGLDEAYRSGYDVDRQLPLYTWALRKMKYEVAGAVIDAAAKIIPVRPEMRKTPFPVYELDAVGDVVMKPDDEGVLKPVHVERPEVDDNGEVVCFKTGPRAGQPKMKRVTRPGLQSMLNSSGGLEYHTTTALMLEAIEYNGLDPADYDRELTILRGWEDGSTYSPYFWRELVPYSDAEVEEAARSAAAVCAIKERLPAVAMPDRFKCRMCAFRRPCAERDPERRAAIIAEGFTTREQRAVATDTPAPDVVPDVVDMPF